MTYQPGPQPYTQGPVPPQYPTQPPPKKSNTLKIILIVLAVIVALCGIGSVLTGKDDKGAKGSSTSAPGDGAAADKAPSPGLNTPVRDGKFEFVVTQVQSGIKEVGDNQYLQKTAQGSYTIVSITVSNTSNKPYGFSPSDQYLFDDQNRKFSNDAAAGINLQSDTSLYADINPGNTVTAQIVFDLPAGAVPDHIVLHDSMFSGGTTVSLR
ncbi:DUF4352 domain-containing protein [Nocardia jejuensis]|uniref:DUF4352 domain-containing protein n=1 Tax=Nocardia jejuensis TaxID=328049 RepID=UPI00083536F5|nr:DUF4352 domain-containing protein [Nocardia jejuensis]